MRLRSAVTAAVLGAAVAIGREDGGGAAVSGPVPEGIDLAFHDAMLCGMCAEPSDIRTQTITIAPTVAETMDAARMLDTLVAWDCCNTHMRGSCVRYNGFAGFAVAHQIRRRGVIICKDTLKDAGS